MKANYVKEQNLAEGTGLEPVSLTTTRFPSELLIQPDTLHYSEEGMGLEPMMP